LLLALALLALLPHLRIHDGYGKQMVFGFEVGNDAIIRVRRTIQEHNLYKIPRKVEVFLSSVRKRGTICFNIKTTTLMSNLVSSLSRDS
jgi:hypothetical protein